MNKFRIFITLLSLLILLLFTFLPVLSYSVEQVSNEVTTENSTWGTSDSLRELNSTEELLESIDATEMPADLENTETEQSHKPAEELTEDQPEDATASSTEESENIEKKQARTNVSSEMTVTDWQLLKNGVELSEAVHAVTGETYELKFRWEVNHSTLSPGDFVTFRMPFNCGPAGDGAGASGSWRISGSSQAVPLTTVIEGQTVKFGEWFIEAYEGGIDYEQIRIQFTEGVRMLEGVNLGSDISTGVDSIKNYTYKGGIQKVEFAGIKKSIDFSQDKLEKSTGWNYKNAIGASDNQIQFDIPVNLPASVELGGDRFVYSSETPEGWAYDPINPAYDWGEHVTDMEDIYLEDTLDEGVIIHGVLIMAATRAPMQLPPDALEHYRGGIVANLSSFNSYLLADFGNGPIYRTPNDPTSERQLPKQEYSFRRIYQEANERKEEFRERVKSAPYQYGIFTDTDTNRQTLMAFFGDVKRGGAMPKYSDLTDQKYAEPQREVAGERTDTVFSFAEQAATRLIVNGHYTEADREELEAYFSLVYGDDNVLGGQVATFEISLTAQYPPDTKSGEKSNTAHHFFTGPHAPDFPILNEVTGSHRLTNPYSSVQLSSNEAMLFKFTEKNLPLNGAKFQLQKKDEANQWRTVEDSEVTTNTVAVNVLEGEGVVERQLDGCGKISNLPDGTYRFVEINSLDGYDPTLSPNYDEEEEKVLSAEFSIPAPTQRSTLFVTNIAQPKYSVQHYVQTGSGTAESDFELRLQESFTERTGTEVSAVAKSFAGYRLDETNPNAQKDGEVLEDGSLVLKLYYVKDETIQPFYFYKYDENRHPMPSTDFKGDPLGEDKEVIFDVYKYNVNGWGAGDGYSPKEVVPTSGTMLPNNKGPVWEKVDTITTDSNGKASSSSLSLTEDNGDLITFAVVETKTYDGYKLPEDNQYWIIWTADKVNEQPVTPFINGINAENGAPEVGEVDSTAVHNEKEYYITNKDENWTFYKKDLTGASMPSVNAQGTSLGENKKVTFDWYLYDGHWTDEQDPTVVPPGEADFWIKKGTLTTNAHGKLVGDAIPREPGKTLGLIETSTYKGYRLPTPQQAHWVLWDSGYIESCGSDNQGTEFIEPYHYVLKNDYATEMKIFKTDAATRTPLRRTEKAKVGFRYYRYKGGWGDEGPDKNTDLTNENDWVPLKNQQDNSYIFYADEEGCLTGLEDHFIGVYPHGNTYAIQEVEAYPGYQLDSGYWYFFLNENKKPKTYTIDWLGHVGEGNPIVEPNDPSNEFNAYQLTNHQLPYPDLEFTKIDDSNSSLANVVFELYQARGNVAFNETTEKNCNYWDLSAPYLREESKLSGKVSFKKLPNGIYLLRETKTAAGFHLPDGDWVIEVDSAAEPKITIRARIDTSPPAFKVENGKCYLPNHRKQILPFSGRWGKDLVLIIGILLIGLAGVVKVEKKEKLDI